MTPENDITIPASDMHQAEGLIVAELKSQMGKNRRQFGRALILFTIGLAVVALIGWNARQTARIANGAAAKAETNQQAAYRTCLASNVSREGIRTFWINDILPIFVRPSNSAATNASIAFVQAKVNDLYGPLQCGKAPPGFKVTTTTVP